MGRPDFHSIKDGETLSRLASGLEIVRREKHEWKSSLENLSLDKLTRRTDKIWGSKFFADWTLPVLVAWIEQVVIAEGWRLQAGNGLETERILDRKIGLVEGERTCKIKVVCDGRYIHAYPIKE